MGSAPGCGSGGAGTPPESGRAASVTPVPSPEGLWSRRFPPPRAPKGGGIADGSASGGQEGRGASRMAPPPAVTQLPVTRRFGPSAGQLPTRDTCSPGPGSAGSGHVPGVPPGPGIGAPARAHHPGLPGGGVGPGSPELRPLGGSGRDPGEPQDAFLPRSLILGEGREAENGPRAPSLTARSGSGAQPGTRFGRIPAPLLSQSTLSLLEKKPRPVFLGASSPYLPPGIRQIGTVEGPMT
ncbi:uncharacterized protein ACOB8E_005668 [Sarcophilus harrisii]